MHVLTCRVRGVGQGHRAPGDLKGQSTGGPSGPTFGPWPQHSGKGVDFFWVPTDRPS